MGAGVRVIDPPRSRSWKATAQEHMRLARGRRPLLEGPVRVVILAVFACPKSDYRRKFNGLRWCDRAYGDADNIAKAVLDAGNSVLWLDDRQVASLKVDRIIGVPGEGERVWISASKIEDFCDQAAEVGLGRDIPGQKASQHPDGQKGPL